MKKGFLVLSALALLACSACTIKVIPIPGGNSQPSSEQTSENPQGGSQEGGSQGGTSQGSTSQGGTSQGGTSQGGTSQGGGSETQGETFVINKANCGIDNTEGLEAAKQVEYTVASGKMKLEWSQGCYQYNKYDEIAIPKGGYLKVISLPAGKKVGTIKMDMYKSQSMTVHASADGSGAAITGVDGTATSNNDSVVKSFVINNEKFYLGVDSSSQYAQSFYTLEINLINSGDTPTTDSQGGNESQGGQTESTSQGGTSQGGQTADYLGAHASQTGEVPAGAQTISFDFTGLSTFGDMPLSSTKKCNTGTVTAQEKDWNYSNASFHTSDTNNPQAYLALYANEAKAVASFGNKTAISKIVKVSFTLTNTASDRARYVIDFGQSELSPSTDGNGVLVQKGADNSLYCEPGYNATHFRICARQGVSSTNKASWYNINIATLTVTYVAA